MTFKLRPDCASQYNHVLLRKNFLKFKKGDIIWANHSLSDEAFYCNPSGRIEVTRKRNKKHLDYFYRCAVPIEGTTWKSDLAEAKFTIKHYRAGGCCFEYSDIKAILYWTDKRVKKSLFPADMRGINRNYICINLEDL